MLTHQHLTRLKSRLCAGIHNCLFLLADIQGRISNAPEGSLRTARKAHGCQYYHKVEVNDTKGTYIKKHNYNLAIELAQKDYDLRIEQCLLKELNFLEVILKKYNPSEIQHIYDSLNIFRKEMVTPVFVSDEDFTANWKASEYTSLGFTPDCAEYYTDNGDAYGLSLKLSQLTNSIAIISLIDTNILCSYNLVS